MEDQQEPFLVDAEDDLAGGKLANRQVRMAGKKRNANWTYMPMYVQW